MSGNVDGSVTTNRIGYVAVDHGDAQDEVYEMVEDRNWRNAEGHNNSGLTARPTEMGAPVEPQRSAKSIEIEPLSYGYLVRVGCQRFAISKLEDLVSGLGTYLADPHNTEIDWFNGKFKIGE